MKLFIFTAILAFHFFSMAQTVSVNIDGKTYTCSGGSSAPSTCDDALDAFQTQMSYCTSAPTYMDGSACAVKVWPSFKQANPQCASKALKSCLSYCTSAPTYWDGSKCATEVCI